MRPNRRKRERIYSEESMGDPLHRPQIVNFEVEAVRRRQVDAGGAAGDGFSGWRLGRPEDCPEGARRAVPGHRQPVRPRPRGEAWP